MPELEWSTTHAVFVTELDDEHAEIVAALSTLRESLATEPAPSAIQRHAQTVATRTEDHFAHEERLMRAARYDAYQWHKGLHDHARRRVEEFLSQLEEGAAGAGGELVEYLTSWLHDHTRVADMMLGAFLRNHYRGLYRVTFRAGTRPAGTCKWRNAQGEPFDPGASTPGY